MTMMSTKMAKVWKGAASRALIMKSMNEDRSVCRDVTGAIISGEKAGTKEKRIDQRKKDLQKWLGRFTAPHYKLTTNLVVMLLPK